jgi:hypothetical protein
MGNIVLVKKVLSGSNVQSTKKFQLEDMIKNEIVRAVFRKFVGETGQYHDEYVSLDTLFDDFEKQANENDNDNWKRNLIKELNEMHTAGLSNADYFTQDLKETSKFGYSFVSCCLALLSLRYF